MLRRDGYANLENWMMENFRRGEAVMVTFGPDGKLIVLSGLEAPENRRNVLAETVAVALDAHIQGDSISSIAGGTFTHVKEPRHGKHWEFRSSSGLTRKTTRGCGYRPADMLEVLVRDGRMPVVESEAFPREMMNPASLGDLSYYHWGERTPAYLPLRVFNTRGEYAEIGVWYRGLPSDDWHRQPFDDGTEISFGVLPDVLRDVEPVLRDILRKYFDFLPPGSESPWGKTYRTSESWDSLPASGTGGEFPPA